MCRTPLFFIKSRGDFAVKYRLAAPCLFGLETLTAGELRDMGAQDVIAENGRVLFSGDDNMIARANICSRYAERILILTGEFEAHSFTDLFDGVKSVEWERYIGKKDAFPVKGWSLNSDLHSIPDCQSIIKKAVVNRLKSKYGIEWFDETGPARKISFSIMKNKVSVMIDTSGDGLHKRGYRKNANDAPLKETLAAAMVYLAHIYPDSTLYDPMCGSGTILIEAALMARNIAPGLRRSFAAEQYDFIPVEAWREERARAFEKIDTTVPFRAVGSDIDAESVKLTLENAKKAGVDGCVTAEVADIKDFAPKTERAVVVTNPPYGERMLDQPEAQGIYKTMGKVFVQKRGYKYNIISSDDEFEQCFGRKADKRRKLYNGSLRCQLYMYFK
jgi:putative N6-adenine-specific DNA methylase